MPCWPSLVVDAAAVYLSEGLAEFRPQGSAFLQVRLPASCLQEQADAEHALLGHEVERALPSRRRREDGGLKLAQSGQDIQHVDEVG